MNKKLLLAIGLIPLVIILAIVFNNRDAPSSATDSKRQLSELQSIEEGFMEAEVFINAQAPIKIDDQTRLEKALAGPGDMITYFYTLTTVSFAKSSQPLCLRRSNQNCSQVFVRMRKCSQCCRRVQKLFMSIQTRTVKMSDVLR